MQIGLTVQIPDTHPQFASVQEGVEAALAALGSLPSWLLPLALGLVLLSSGRRLYWLLLGAVGFVLGYAVLSQLAFSAESGAPWIAALLGGLLGVLAAFFIQGALLAVVGAVLGGFTALVLLSMFEWSLSFPLAWLLLAGAIVGAVVGAIVLRRLFFASLVVATSVLGASLLLQAVTLAAASSPSVNDLLWWFVQPGLPRSALFAVLIVCGLILQTRDRRRTSRAREERKLREARRELERELSRARRSRG